jgi:hypothetical protein
MGITLVTNLITLKTRSQKRTDLPQEEHKQKIITIVGNYITAFRV